MSRRRLFFGGIAAEVLDAGAVPAVAADPRQVTIDGLVERTAPATVAIRMPGRDDLVGIRLRSGATVERNGPAELADFVPGNHVWAAGRWSGEHFLASELALLEVVPSREDPAEEWEQ
jgi:hypothetical protein